MITAENGKAKHYDIPNPGNWGDALIRYGTLKFLRSIIGVQYTELKSYHDAAELIQAENVLIFGGGETGKT